jgi:formylglycine-generating enzyme required for sulfatase activity
MKSIWLTVCIFIGIDSLSILRAGPDEPGKSQTPAADSMIGEKPGEVRDANGLKMKLVWCPSGEFTMGSPESETSRRDNEDQVKVNLTNGFWLSKYEVTKLEWKHLMATEPWQGKPATQDGDDFPATSVCWEDVINFCRTLTSQEHDASRLPANWEYTLPTEAQWERACRAGSATRFHMGDDDATLPEYEWFHASAFGIGKRSALQVGQKKANQWGLHDMHGNVREWCRDCYAADLPGGRDPESVNDTLVRAVRGGCWLCSPGGCRSAVRMKFGTRYRVHDLGFRVALIPSGAK